MSRTFFVQRNTGAFASESKQATWRKSGILTTRGFAARLSIRQPFALCLRTYEDKGTVSLCSHWLLNLS